MFTFRFVTEENIGPEPVDFALKSLYEEIGSAREIDIYRISISVSPRTKLTTVMITFSLYA